MKPVPAKRIPEGELYSSDERAESTSELDPNQNGDLFGRSLEGCDVNNDGFDELIVGNTGSFEDALSYPVEYYYGSSAGYNGTPDHTLASITQGRLFGLVVACVGDLNGDGMMNTSSPNRSTARAPSGRASGFEGTNGTTWQADWQFEPRPPTPRW